MRIAKTLLSLLWMTMLAALVLPSARASEFDQKTILTFSQSVEIPGRILPAGTYVVKLNSVGDRNVVQIFDKQETHLYATILAVSEYRFQPSDKPEIQLKERTTGGLKAIQTWFYSGLLDGKRFTYRKAQAEEVGQQINQPVPDMPSGVTQHPPSEPMEQADRSNNMATMGASPAAISPKDE